MADCIPIADFANIKTFPIQAKAPIISLAVVLSVVVTVAVIVVVFLVRKLSALKKVGGDVGAHLKAGAVAVSGNIPDVDVEGIKGKLPDTSLNKSLGVAVDGIAAAVELGYDAKDKLLDVKGKLPDVKGVAVGGLAVGVDKSLEFGAGIKGAIQGSFSVDLDIGLDVNNPFFVIFDALPYASVLLNAKGAIVKANAACKLKWGYPSAQLEGKLYKTLISPKALEARLELIDALIHGKRPAFEVDSFDITIDGVEVEVEVIGAVISILGKAYIFLITGHVCFNVKGQRYKDN